MGQKNADRIPLAYRRARCPTVEAMQRDKWDIISKCGACGLIMQVDLALVARISGPQTVLWNRKARCRRLGCAGVVEFMAKVPGVGWHAPLRADDREP